MLMWLFVVLALVQCNNHALFCLPRAHILMLCPRLVLLNTFHPAPWAPLEALGHFIRTKDALVAQGATGFRSCV